MGCAPVGPSEHTVSSLSPALLTAYWLGPRYASEYTECSCTLMCMIRRFPLQKGRIPMCSSRQAARPAPSRLGRVLGYALLAASVACLAIFVFTAPAPVHPESRLLWIGLGIFLLASAPGLLFALSPRLLGGPLGRYMRAIASRGRGSRASGLMLAWTGTCISAIGWAPALIPALRASQTTLSLLVLGALVLAVLTPLILWRAPPPTR